jgi:hypothetical protein
MGSGELNPHFVVMFFLASSIYIGFSYNAITLSNASSIYKNKHT